MCWRFRRSSAAGTLVAAAVTVSISNLAGMQRDIGLREVGENNGVSHMGSHGLLAREVIDFEITALSDGAQSGSGPKLVCQEHMGC